MYKYCYVLKIYKVVDFLPIFHVLLLTSERLGDHKSIENYVRQNSPNTITTTIRESLLTLGNQID